MSENHNHWADKKEVIKTNKPLKFVLILIKYTPRFLLHIIIFPVALFYYFFAKSARKSAIQYQKQLREFTNHKVPSRVSSYREICSFAFCLIEKMEGWLGKIKFSCIKYHDDDIDDILANLKERKGVLLITSHLGNMELLRSLSDYNRQLVGHDVPVYVVMDMQVNNNFTDTLKTVNKNFSLNIINSTDIGPDSMVTLMEAVENGSIVVIAGDRTSAKEREKVIEQSFLCKKANFPYGVFLMPFLLKVPVYYMFGLRGRISIFGSKQNVYIEKSKIDFECPRTEREKNIKLCCAEFVSKLEKFCALYPYQWYNFFDFWSDANEEK